MGAGRELGDGDPLFVSIGFASAHLGEGPVLVNGKDGRHDDDGLRSVSRRARYLYRILLTGIWFLSTQMGTG